MIAVSLTLGNSFLHYNEHTVLGHRTSVAPNMYQYISENSPKHVHVHYSICYSRLCKNQTVRSSATLQTRVPSAEPWSPKRRPSSMRLLILQTIRMKSKPDYGQQKLFSGSQIKKSSQVHINCFKDWCYVVARLAVGGPSLFICTHLHSGTTEETNKPEKPSSPCRMVRAGQVGKKPSDLTEEGKQEKERGEGAGSEEGRRKRSPGEALFTSLPLTYRSNEVTQSPS